MGALEAIQDANGQMAAEATAQLLSPDDHLRVDYEFPKGVPDLDDARPETLAQLGKVAKQAWRKRRDEILPWITAT